MKLRDLHPILDEAFEVFGDKSEYVVAVPMYRAAANTATGWKNANLRSEMTRLLRRAGVAGWPRLFHSMRASRQSELQREIPLHIVCSWPRQLTTHRAAELFASYRRRFRQGRWGEKGDGGGLMT
jgi:hypothetical protein